MPFESSLPLVLACLIGGLVTLSLWFRQRSLWLLVLTGQLLSGGTAAFIADRLVITDREQLEELFPRLARAAETQDVPTIIAALDPELRGLEQEATRLMKQVQPTEVTITRLDIAIDAAKAPPQAAADLIVRLTGDLIDKATPGTALVGVKVLLHKKHGRWLIKDAEGTPIRPGRP